MKVVVAEDYEPTRILLEGSLSQWGYDIRSFNDGSEAWQMISGADTPLIVLLDWEMPGMSGVEICKRLKARKEGPFVYAIILTSHSDRDRVVEGLASGAHDFIAKPFDRYELKSRLEVGARILEYERVLQEKNEALVKYAEQMEVLAEERARQLIHADRLATLGTMSAGVAHEINNPAAVLWGNVEMLKVYWEKLEPIIQERIERNGVEEEISMIYDDMPVMTEHMRSCVERISNTARNLGRYARRGSSDRSQCDVNRCIEASLKLCENVLMAKITVEFSAQEGLPKVRGDQQEIEQVLVNLYTNGAHAMLTQGGGTLKVQAREVKGRVQVVVEDTGPGISAENLPLIFDSFFTTKEDGQGTGLGLFVSKNIIENHEGTMVVESEVGQGTRFTIELPGEGSLAPVNPGT